MSDPEQLHLFIGEHLPRIRSQRALMALDLSAAVADAPMT